MIRYRVLAIARLGSALLAGCGTLEDEDGRPRPSEALHQQVQVWEHREKRRPPPDQPEGCGPAGHGTRNE